MVGLHLTSKQDKKPAKKSSVLDRMEKLAAGDVGTPGAPRHVGDGFYTVDEGTAKKAELKARATKALANKPAAAPAKKKVVAQAREVFVPVAAGAVTRKVGGASTVASAVKQITAWSFSRYNDWLGCPLKAKFKYIDGLKEPGNAAMQRGSEIHGLAEQYARGQLKNLPLELAKFKAEFLALVKQKPECEGEWAFTKDWEETGWFEKGLHAAWCRIKTDVAYYDKKSRTVVVIDHKTGKVNPAHAAQLTLYAIGAFIKYPDALKVSARLWYLDHGEETSQEFSRAQFEALKAEWNGKVSPMLADTRFQARPGAACKYCFFKNSNGGPCRF